MTRTEQLRTFYTETVNNLTLEKALVEHYKINPQFTRYDQFETVEAGNIIKSHDISHIIYGCDTSLPGEFKVQMWNNFGSSKTMPKLNLKNLLNKDFNTIMRLVIPTGLFGFVAMNFKELMGVRKQVKTQADQMTKKWIYGEEEKYMNKTIDEIRDEFGIEILD
jgi:ubiquinone biosynthesis protein Coq4